MWPSLPSYTALNTDARHASRIFRLVRRGKHRCVGYSLRQAITTDCSNAQGSYGGHSGYFHSAPTYGGYGHSSGYDAQPAKTEIRPPTSKVTREQKDGEDTTERQLQRQIIHRQRQQNTRSEQTHRHDHHVEKLHK